MGHVAGELAEPRATDSELEMRRERVLALRMRKMTEAAIVAICGVSEATVCMDLQWIAANWRERYGP